MSKIALLGSRTGISQNASTSQYVPFANSNTFGNTDNIKTVRTSGVASGLLITVTTNDRAASSFAIRINGVDGNQILTIPGSTTGTFEDTTNSDTIAAGDEVNFRSTTGAGGTSYIWIAMRCFFAATANTVTRVGSADHDAVSTASTRFFYALGGRCAVAATTETGELINIKTAGTLKNLSANVSANARSTTTALGVRINGADSALVLSVSSSTTGQFEDTSNTVTVAVNGTACGYILTGTGSGNFRCANGWSFEFETTNDNWQMFSGQSTANGATMAASGTFYRPLGGVHDDDITTEANAQVKLGIACVLHFMQVRVTSNTVSATSTARLRKNGADGTISVSITASTTGLFEDTTNRETILPTDLVNYQYVIGGSGTSLGITCVSILGEIPLPRRHVPNIQSMVRASYF